jgi:hypothetical protein
VVRSHCQSRLDATAMPMVQVSAWLGVNHEPSTAGRQDSWPRSRPIPITPRGVVFRMSNATPLVLARAALERPILNNFLPNRRSGHSVIDILMGGHK